LNDTNPHEIRIEVKDAAGNTAVIAFSLQYDPSIRYAIPQGGVKWSPGLVNIFEAENFEAFSTENSIYDTVAVNYTASNTSTGSAVSALHYFMGSSIPVHDTITVRIRDNLKTGGREDKVIIKSISGTRTVVQKATWSNGWFTAKFRQFGTFQAFIDNEPPTVNAPSSNLSRASRIVFTPHDNFNAIKSFRAELDGEWLRFTNDKGRSWIYNFDEHFPRGQHELKVTIEDVAGNVTTRSWTVNR
jgi:hypothetical protein